MIAFIFQKLPKVNPDFARKLIEAKEEAAAGNKKKVKVRHFIYCGWCLLGQIRFMIDITRSFAPIWMLND